MSFHMEKQSLFEHNEYLWKFSEPGWIFDVAQTWSNGLGAQKIEIWSLSLHNGLVVSVYHFERLKRF